MTNIHTEIWYKGDVPEKSIWPWTTARDKQRESVLCEAFNSIAGVLDEHGVMAFRRSSNSDRDDVRYAYVPEDRVESLRKTLEMDKKWRVYPQYPRGRDGGGGGIDITPVICATLACG